SSPATRPQTVVLGELLYRLGNAHHALNQYQMAIEKYDQALKLARDVHMPLFEAVVLGDFAETQLKTGNPEAALSSASLAISTLQSGGGSKHLESKFLNTIAESQKALGRIDDALSTYRQAITAIEQSRSHSIPTEISRAGIVAMRQKVFAGAIEFLVDQHRIAESLEVAEKYHARAFLDILAETGIDASEGISKENKEHEEKLFERISSIQKKIWQGRTSKPDQATESEQELKRQLRVAENDLESFQLELRRINPRYATIKYPQPIKPEQIADEILDSETAIIEFVLSDQRSVGWIIKKDRIDAVVLPARKEIESLIAEYREAFSGRVYSLTAGQAIAKVKAQSRVLYEKVFHPFEPYLANTKKLIIIPDGSLNYLPFETLTSEEKASANNHQRSSYLIERFAISYAPSITALARLNSINGKRATKAIGFIAFGDPQYTSFAAEGKESIPLVKRSEQGFEFRQLPWTRTEVNDVAGLFPATERKVFIGTEAKEENAKSETLAGYRYIHFAAHGMIDEDFPARSGIALTADAESKDDGILQMNEVMRLKLNADLVTLSACRTGLGKVMNGEGIVGLTRSFLYAGADSLLVSLWNVNDVATALLMKSFYANLQRGMSKSEALRQAKLELLSNQKRAWRHPYFWAAFVLVGLPK
ncbi:MAG TPA: CHAT domain-containing protein, partial [Blastocatellia bacterium]|nr:CHAT domain-containing protein [Blastocatellia bacterium]